MALVTGKTLLDAARTGGYAVGAFNCHTLDMVTAVVAVAVAEQAPVILQFSEGSLRANTWEAVAAVAGQAARDAVVPVAIHLDHGASFPLVIKAIRHGFTSVMIDGSELPYGQNVALTRQVVEAARAAGVSVEAEIGHVGGVEDGQGRESGWMTDPEDAERFWRECGMDYLATAFGTAHGLYKEEPRLDLDRLAAIGQRVPAPLVMHGGSGVPDDQVRASIERGIAKVNVATELKEAWAQALRETLAARPGEADPRKIMGPPRDAVKAVVRTKIRLFGANGKAITTAGMIAP
jgi:fructose-bisphosphate aldolase, class II